MKTRIIACAGLLLCASPVAQGFMTTPPGGLAREGSGSSSHMGNWANMRIQQIDDMHSDGKAKALIAIAFRLDGRNHTSTTATGRTWSKITVNMAQSASYESISNNLQENLGYSAVRVFDSKWSWPTYNGFPPLSPDIWGGVQGRLAFPFVRPWVYAAKSPILAEYTFQGGTFANRVAWSTSARAHFYLDSEIFDNLPIVGYAQALPPVRPVCADSAAPGSAAAYTGMDYKAYPKDLPFAYFRGKLLLNYTSYNTAPDAPVLHVLGTRGVFRGLDIGAGCNKLYLDLTKPVALAFPTTWLTGAGYMNWLGDWRSELANLTLWFQAAWTDSQTSAFKLTSASNITFPSRLPSEYRPRYKTVAVVGPTSVTGYGPLSTGDAFPHTYYRLQ